MSFKHEKLPCRILEGNGIYTVVRCIDMHSIFADICSTHAWHQELPKVNLTQFCICHDSNWFICTGTGSPQSMSWHQSVWLKKTENGIRLMIDQYCKFVLCVFVRLFHASFVAALLFPASHQREGWRHGGAEVPLRKCQRWRRRFTSIWLLDDMLNDNLQMSHFAKWQSKDHKYWQKPAVSSSHGGHLCQNLVTQSPILCFFSLETKMHSLSADGVRESDFQDRAGRLYFDGCCMVWSNGKLLAQGARAPDYTVHSAHCSSWSLIVLWRCFIAVTRACTDDAFDKIVRWGTSDQWCNQEGGSVVYVSLNGFIGRPKGTQFGMLDEIEVVAAWFVPRVFQTARLNHKWNVKVSCLCVVWVYHLIHQTKSTCLIILFWSRVHDIHLFTIHQHPFMSGGIRRRIFQNVPTHPSKVKGCRVFLAPTLRPDIPYLAFNFKWMIFIKYLYRYIYIYHYIVHDHGCKNSFTRSPPWTWTTSDPCDPTSLLDLFKHPQLQLCSEWRLTLNIHGPFSNMLELKPYTVLLPPVS